MEVPLFPLHTVLCPGIALPLHIFEPRYRVMVGRCLAEERPFGVVWIREGRDVGLGELAVATVGTLAEIREAERLPDGRYELVAVGTRRFRLESVATDAEPYLVGHVTLLDDPPGDEARIRRLARLVTRRFVRYVGSVRALGDLPGGGRGGPGSSSSSEAPEAATEAPAGAADAATDQRAARTDDAASAGAGLGVPADPALLAHLLAGVVETDLPHRQALLEADTTEERLIELANLLAREVAYLEQELRLYEPDPRGLAARRN